MPLAVALYRVCFSAIFIYGACCCSATVGAAPTIDDVNRAYDRRWAGLENIRCDYRSQRVPLLATSKLFELDRLFEFPARELTVVLTREGHMYRRERDTVRTLDDIHKWLIANKRLTTVDGARPLTYSEINEGLPHVRPTEREFLDVFDGSRLISKDPGTLASGGIRHTVFHIVYVPRLRSPHFALSPLEFSLCTFRCPGLPKDDEHRQKHRIPDVLSLRPFAIDQEMETIDGDDCVVLRSKDYQTMWLLPEMGFAPRKRQFFRDGVVIMDVECRDYRLAGNELWLPNEVVITDRGAKGYVPAEYEGVPLYRTTYRMAAMAINTPDNLRVFDLKFSGGDYVIDETLVKEERKGTVVTHFGGSRGPAAISYVMPADQEDLDEVIRQAQTKAKGKSLAQRWLGSPIVWTTAVIVAGLAALTIWRRLAK